ncbi:MAG: GtrA family protein [Candidatus Nealsonbacteria bacterium]|nr:GtrA family protein [Candidatus Nealsonbacteria bacterium]
MKKVDVILALVTGEIAGWYFYGMLKDMKVAVFDKPYMSLVMYIIFPLLTLFGLWICFFLGKKFISFFQLAKYLLIGVLATLVDLGVFNLLMGITGMATGNPLKIFKGASFLVATFSKYFGDKFWAFEKMEKEGMKKEITTFFLVTLVGLAVNVGVTAMMVTYLNANGMVLFGSQVALTDKLIANLGAIVAAVVVAAWNFVGYKFIVFKK